MEDPLTISLYWFLLKPFDVQFSNSMSNPCLHCRGKPTIDDHSVYGQLKVLIPAGWDYTQAFGTQVYPDCLEQGAFIFFYYNLVSLYPSCSPLSYPLPNSSSSHTPSSVH